MEPFWSHIWAILSGKRVTPMPFLRKESEKARQGRKRKTKHSYDTLEGALSMGVPYGPKPRELRDQPVWSFDTALVALAWSQLTYMDGADLLPELVYTHMPER